VSFRHAAALALAGWYLLMPPFTSEGTSPVDRAAPYSNWLQIASYATAAECRKAKQDASDAAKDEEACSSTVKLEAYLCLRKMAAVCVSSDDPSLGN
jgi:hypothetical protein